MSVGSISGAGTRFSAISVGIRSTGSNSDTEKISKQLASPSKSVDSREGTENREAAQTTSQTSRDSTGSSTASTETPDYSSMSTSDLLKLVRSGDKNAQKELEKRESKNALSNGQSSDTNQNESNVHVGIDIIA